MVFQVEKHIDIWVYSYQLFTESPFPAFSGQNKTELLSDFKTSLFHSSVSTFLVKSLHNA